MPHNSEHTTRCLDGRHVSKEHYNPDVGDDASMTCAHCGCYVCVSCRAHEVPTVLWFCADCAAHEVAMDAQADHEGEEIAMEQTQENAERYRARKLTDGETAAYNLAAGALAEKLYAVLDENRAAFTNLEYATELADLLFDLHEHALDRASSILNSPSAVGPRRELIWQQADVSARLNCADALEGHR